MKATDYQFSAVVLQDGHIDRISGPRCVVRMREGPHVGLYLIASTDEVLPLGTEVIYDEITRRARALAKNTDTGGEEG